MSKTEKESINKRISHFSSFYGEEEFLTLIECFFILIADNKDIIKRISETLGENKNTIKYV